MRDEIRASFKGLKSVKACQCALARYMRAQHGAIRKEHLRKLCKSYKIYDVDNFTSYMKSFEKVYTRIPGTNKYKVTGWY